MAGIAELAAGVATRTGLTKTAALEAVNAVKDEILAICKAGEEVNLTGFAKFSAKNQPARECTNPQNPTGPKVKVAAKTVFAIKPSKSADVTPAKPASGRRK